MLDAALDRIAVYFNASVIDEVRQAVPMVEGVAIALPRPDFFETSSSRAPCQGLKSSISGLVSVCRTTARTNGETSRLNVPMYCVPTLAAHHATAYDGFAISRRASTDRTAPFHVCAASRTA
jgi:hypothetical protein